MPRSLGDGDGLGREVLLLGRFLRGSQFDRYILVVPRGKYAHYGVAMIQSSRSTLRDENGRGVPRIAVLERTVLTVENGIEDRYEFAGGDVLAEKAVHSSAHRGRACRLAG